MKKWQGVEAQEPLPGRIHSMSALPGRSTFAANEEGILYEKRR